MSEDFVKNARLENIWFRREYHLPFNKQAALLTLKVSMYFFRICTTTDQYIVKQTNCFSYTMMTESLLGF